MLNHSHIYDKNGKSVHQKCIICKCIAVYSSCARNNMDFIHQDSSKWMYCYNFRINFCGHTIFIFFSIFFKCKKKRELSTVSVYSNQMDFYEMAGVQQPHTGFTFKIQSNSHVCCWRENLSELRAFHSKIQFVCYDLRWINLISFEERKKNERNEVMLKFKIWFNRWTRNQTESATNNRRLTNLPNYFFIKKTNERTKKPTNQLKKKSSV